jgi:Skp family chaperone for outer membrane proteins
MLLHNGRTYCRQTWSHLFWHTKLLLKISHYYPSDLQALQEQLEAADVALQDSQQLRMDYDRMCQQAYELSRKLSQAESARGELQRQLAGARCGC